MFMDLYKFNRLVMHLNSFSMDLGRDSWPSYVKPVRTRKSPKSEHPNLEKDTLLGLEVRGKCFVTSALFLLVPKKLCSTLGSFYPACTATPLLVHARSYLIPKGLQPTRVLMHTLIGPVT